MKKTINVIFIAVLATYISLWQFSLIYIGNIKTRNLGICKIWIYIQINKYVLNNNSHLKNRANNIFKCSFLAFLLMKIYLQIKIISENDTGTVEIFNGKINVKSLAGTQISITMPYYR